MKTSYKEGSKKQRTDDAPITTGGKSFLPPQTSIQASAAQLKSSVVQKEGEEETSMGVQESVWDYVSDTTTTSSTEEEIRNEEEQQSIWEDIHYPTSTSHSSYTPCSRLPRLLGENVWSGRGAADMQYNDFPSVGGAKGLYLDYIRHYSNGWLELSMLTELTSLGRGEGIAAFNHFKTGGGATRSFGVGSSLSNLVRTTSAFQTLQNETNNLIRNNILAQETNGGQVNCNSINIPSTDIPYIGFELLDNATLKAVIGGTKEMHITLKSFTFDTTTRTYSADVEYTIIDHFGVDETDIYSPGLSSFFVLQHERATSSMYRPYLHEIIVEGSISGSL